ncbi:MAG: MATE family efflux transporter [Eubacterium sp.]|jgi:putative MATE family efflux protein
MSDSRTRTLLKYVTPSVLTNACFFLFTVVDGIFVGRGVGSDALGAVNIAAPLIMIAMAINMLTSIGGVTIAAVRFGEGDKEGANQAFMHSLTATAAFSAVMTILCVFLTEPLAVLLGAKDQYVSMTKDYIFWWGLFAIPNSLSVNFQSFCRNDGEPQLVSTATVISTLLNIFLDWLFVFPFKWGVMGAALATGISQTVSWFIVIPHFALKKGELRVCRFKPNAGIFRKVLFRGVPEMIAQFATPVVTICMNRVLIEQYGSSGVNAFSIISYIASLTMSILAGASEGMQPLFGRSYGAKKKDDLKWYFRAGIIISVVGSAVIVLLVMIFDRPLCALFGAKGETMEYTVRYLPQYAWAFVVAGANTMISTYLYSTMRSVYAITLNIFRSFVIDTAVIVGFSAIFGAKVVWFTFGISECFVLVLAICLLKISERKDVAFV